ncbi:hypothetical protein BDV93DRAFT_549353 [Ceratobasidium sp. AG-I]|nr:hypothetical protein BDV93DRAFT_549353 [Ceratobasidium sp. AG-I]
MFNRVPACHFWASFPFDHDSYISSEGTDAYTHSLGQELAPLRCLKNIRLGVYLMPSSAVLAHKASHVRNLPAPTVIDWQQAVPLAIQRTTDEIQPRPTGIPELVSVLHWNPKEQFELDSCSVKNNAIERRRIQKTSKPGRHSARHSLEWIEGCAPVVLYSMIFYPTSCQNYRHNLNPVKSPSLYSTSPNGNGLLVRIFKVRAQGA